MNRVILSAALTLLLCGGAGAADMKDCTTYANRGSAFALRQLLGLPFIDLTTGRFLYRKAYTYCVAADEVPTMTFTVEEQPIVDGLPTPVPRPEPPPGSVPATDDAAEEPAAPPPEPAPPPAVKRAGKVKTGDQPLCSSHGKRTVYTGLHWRCVR